MAEGWSDELATHFRYWCENVAFLGMGALVDAGLIPEEEFERALGIVQELLFVRLCPVAIFTKAVRQTEITAFYEGLPHQMAERELLEEERRTKAVQELNGYNFYQEPLVLAEEDARRLSEVFAETATYHPFMGEQGCGGFHPDYAVEWHGEEALYRALICFGCHEVKLFGPGLESRNNLDQDTYAKLYELLKGYRKNRPLGILR